MTIRLNHLLLLVLIILTPDLLFSQQQNGYKLSLSHPLKFGNENIHSQGKDYIAGVDSFKVVAILVQFVEDNDGRTSGNGKFDLSSKYLNASTGRDTVIDAPPYDSAYFADHLTFLKNYYEKSSKGKVSLSFDLFGKVINLPNTMETYSPQRNESNIKIGNLFQDSWARADSFINFSNYDLTRTAFVIFHAGVGRDVDLASIIGFDPTPYDIPSVYLGLKNLKEFYGNSYNGFQTNDGVFIQNSLIIPSTELRELSLITGVTLVELGMNGILTANFGSYLGLPDLFNTSNGTTAIGRFGLMDGQSLFSYNGIFPPEPSAWEKIYLGWVEPVVVSSGQTTVSIPASSRDIERDSTIFKVLISSSEYFLIENRNRDPQNNGQTMYTRNRTFVDSTVYPQDLENGFYYSNAYTSLHKINGNVTDVETLDWSLPGLINNEFSYKGGILIWHIDESVINANLASNSINNNSNHRGVDLEEAKGAQEIGVTFSTPFGNITGDGTPVDYWFNGSHQVPTSIYKNAFTPSSNPNSLSYSFANNNISITGFSTIDTLMTFNISIGIPALSPLKNFPWFVGKDTSGNTQAIAFDYSGDAGEEIFVNSGNNVYGLNSNGSPIDPNFPSGLLISNFGKYIPASLVNGGIKNIVALSDSGIAFKNSVGLNQYYWSNASASCPPFTIDASGFAYIGKNNGAIRKYDLSGTNFSVDSSAGLIKQFARTSGDTFQYINSSFKYIVIGNINSQGSTDVLHINNNNELFVNGNKLNLNYSLSNILRSPVLADINSDGKQEIILNADGKIYALNSNGVLIDNFPISMNDPVSSGISVADVNGDNIFDVIFATSGGDLFAYGADGKPVSNFPVKIGPGTTSTPALFNMNDTLAIAVAGGDGFIYGFKTGTAYNGTKVLWKNYLKDSHLSNNNFLTGNVPVAISDKLPSDKVYNWPNPVYNNETFIRYFLNGTASSVNIKILDLSGELVTTLKGTSYSGADNEVRWDVSSVQSGVYYGVVEADIDGSKESRIIKIAVVK